MNDFARMKRTAQYPLGHYPMLMPSAVFRVACAFLVAPISVTIARTESLDGDAQILLTEPSIELPATPCATQKGAVATERMEALA